MERKYKISNSTTNLELSYRQEKSQLQVISQNLTIYIMFL